MTHFKLDLLTLADAQPAQNNETCYLLTTISEFYSQLEGYKTSTPLNLKNYTNTSLTDNEKNQLIGYDFGSKKNSFSYSYDETYSESKNSQKTLTFKMDRYVMLGDERVVNPFVNNIHTGSCLCLTDKNDKITLFTIKDINFEIKTNNIIYTYTCQDTFSYQGARQNSGYTIKNDPSSTDFIGAKTIDWWALKITKDCQLPYKYVPFKKGIVNKKLSYIKNTDQSGDIENVQKGLAVVMPDLFVPFTFSISDSTSVGALISLADSYDLTIYVNEEMRREGNVCFFTREFWFKPAKNPLPSGLTYSPNRDIKSFGFNYNGDNLTTVLNVNSSEVNGNLVALFPKMTPFFSSLFNSVSWDKTKYYDGFFTSVCSGWAYHGGKHVVYDRDLVNAFYDKLEFARADLIKAKESTEDSDTEYVVLWFNWNKRNNLYNKLIFARDKESFVESTVNDAIRTNGFDDYWSFVFKDEKDNLYYYDQQEEISQDALKSNLIGVILHNWTSERFTDNITSLISDFDVNLYFYRDCSDEDLEFAKIADKCPWLENRFIDLSYFYSNNTIDKAQYNLLKNSLTNDLRIVNGKLLLYSNQYYQAIHQKTTEMSKILKAIDSLNAAAQSDIISVYAKKGAIADTQVFNSAYTLYKGDNSDTKISLANYDETMSEYIRLYWSARQRFLKNAYNFRKYFNSYVDFAGSSAITERTLQISTKTPFDKGNSTYKWLSIASGNADIEYINKDYKDYNENGYPNRTIFRSSDKKDSYEKVDVAHWDASKNSPTYYKNLYYPRIKEDDMIKTSTYNYDKTYYEKLNDKFVKIPVYPTFDGENSILTKFLNLDAVKGNVYQKETIVYKSVQHIVAPLKASDDNKNPMDKYLLPYLYGSNEVNETADLTFDSFDPESGGSDDLVAASKFANSPLKTIYYKKEDGGYTPIDLLTYSNYASMFHQTSDLNAWDGAWLNTKALGTMVLNPVGPLFTMVSLFRLLTATTTLSLKGPVTHTLSGESVKSRHVHDLIRYDRPSAFQENAYYISNEEMYNSIKNNDWSLTNYSDEDILKNVGLTLGMLRPAGCEKRAEKPFDTNFRRLLGRNLGKDSLGRGNLFVKNPTYMEFVGLDDIISPTDRYGMICVAYDHDTSTKKEYFKDIKCSELDGGNNDSNLTLGDYDLLSPTFSSSSVKYFSRLGILEGQEKSYFTKKFNDYIEKLVQTKGDTRPNSFGDFGLFNAVENIDLRKIIKTSNGYAFSEEKSSYTLEDLLASPEIKEYWNSGGDVLASDQLPADHFHGKKLLHLKFTGTLDNQNRSYGGYYLIVKLVDYDRVTSNYTLGKTYYWSQETTIGGITSCPGEEVSIPKYIGLESLGIYNQSGKPDSLVQIKSMNASEQQKVLEELKSGDLVLYKTNDISSPVYSIPWIKNHLDGGNYFYKKDPSYKQDILFADSYETTINVYKHTSVVSNLNVADSIDSSLIPVKVKVVKERDGSIGFSFTSDGDISYKDNILTIDGYSSEIETSFEQEQSDLDISTLTNGQFWLIYHNRLVGDKLSPLAEQAAIIETQLEEYWSSAYNASLFCDYFLPEHWQPEYEQERNAFSADVLDIQYASVNSKVVPVRVDLKTKYLPKVDLEEGKAHNLLYFSDISEYQSEDSFIEKNYLDYIEDSVNVRNTISEAKSFEAYRQFLDTLNDIISPAYKGDSIEQHLVLEPTYKSSLYSVKEGGTPWPVLFEQLIGTRLDYCNGQYLMILQTLALKYVNNPLNTYNQVLKQHNAIWSDLYSKFPGLLLENSFSDNNAVTSTDLYNSALAYFKDNRKPGRNYSISIINSSALLGYEGQPIYVGDSIKLSANEYYPEVDDVHEALDQYLFISDFNYTLRNEGEVQITVNEIKYQDKLIQSLAKLIR